MGKLSTEWWESGSGKTIDFICVHVSGGTTSKVRWNCVDRKIKMDSLVTSLAAATKLSGKCNCIGRINQLLKLNCVFFSGGNLVVFALSKVNTHCNPIRVRWHLLHFKVPPKSLDWHWRQSLLLGNQKRKRKLFPSNPINTSIKHNSYRGGTCPNKQSSKCPKWQRFIAGVCVGGGVGDNSITDRHAENRRKTPSGGTDTIIFWSWQDLSRGGHDAVHGWVSIPIPTWCGHRRGGHFVGDRRSF